MNNVLIVWSVVPSYTLMYLLEVDDEMFAKMVKANSEMINNAIGEEEAILEEIQNLLDQNTPIFDSRTDNPAPVQFNGHVFNMGFIE